MSAHAHIRVYFERKGITISAEPKNNVARNTIPLATKTENSREKKKKKRSDSHGQLLPTNNLY